VVNLTKHFGGIKAVDNVSLEIDHDELVGLIGPNGSGKTTLVNLITGFLKANHGNVYCKGKPIDGLPPHEIARLKIGRTFQITRLFQKMSVIENMLVPTAPLSATLKKRGNFVSKASELLQVLSLAHLKNELAENLSGGQQKLLELGRVLMLDPELIILDEPFAGVHPELRDKIHSYIKQLHSDGKSFLIISHDISTIFTLSKRLIVLMSGRKIADSNPEIVKNDQRVIEAYLG
jgi:branched-chain amino acid transport system ATP-binding protein